MAGSVSMRRPRSGEPPALGKGSPDSSRRRESHGVFGSLRQAAEVANRLAAAKMARLRRCAEARAQVAAAAHDGGARVARGVTGPQPLLK